MYQLYSAALLSRTTLGAAIDIGAYEYSGSTSTNANQLQTDVVIYPNPSAGKFHLVLPDFISKISELEIYNLLGEKVFSFSGIKIQSQMEVDLSGISKGVYFLKVFSGKRAFINRIIIG
jgi:hypothetical protein